MVALQTVGGGKGLSFFPQYIFAEDLTLLGEEPLSWFHFLEPPPVPVLIPYLKRDRAAVFND